MRYKINSVFGFKFILFLTLNARKYCLLDIISLILRVNLYYSTLKLGSPKFYQEIEN